MRGSPIRMPREVARRVKLAPYRSATFGGRGGIRLRRRLLSTVIDSITEPIDLFDLDVGDVLHIYLAPDTRELRLRAELSASRLDPN